MAALNGPVVAAPVHQSLYRPQLLAGCDREMFLLLCLACVYVSGPLGFIAMKPLIGISGIAAFVAGRKALAFLAKEDPQFRTVYCRSAGDPAFYPARPRLGEGERTAYPGWSS